MNYQNHIVKTESALKLWHIRNLKIEGKALVFKSLAISKIIHLSLITAVSHAIIKSTMHKKPLYGTEKPLYGTEKIQK